MYQKQQKQKLIVKGNVQKNLFKKKLDLKNTKLATDRAGSFGNRTVNASNSSRYRAGSFGSRPQKAGRNTNNKGNSNTNQQKSQSSTNQASTKTTENKP